MAETPTGLLNSHVHHCFSAGRNARKDSDFTEATELRNGDTHSKSGCTQTTQLLGQHDSSRPVGTVLGPMSYALHCITTCVAISAVEDASQVLTPCGHKTSKWTGCVLQTASQEAAHKSSTITVHELWNVATGNARARSTSRAVTVQDTLCQSTSTHPPHCQRKSEQQH